MPEVKQIKEGAERRQPTHIIRLEKARPRNS